MNLWQHAKPLTCPVGHVMIWLGTAWWICEKCHQIYGQTEHPGNDGSRNGYSWIVSGQKRENAQQS